ncbi:MAG: hypothetical protein EAX81_03550 [Candidatus Thorarchaeota archaeon]|nr:hypothetical protein [Candidatus Thorarchaeota archaeon]
MKTEDILRSSFKCVAGHFANLEQIRRIIERISGENGSIDDMIRKLEEMMQDVDVTLKTDLRILLNEIRHQIRKSSG